MLNEFLANPSTKLKKYVESAKRPTRTPMTRQAAGSIEYNLKEGLVLLCTRDARNHVATRGDPVKCFLKSSKDDFKLLAGTSRVMLPFRVGFGGMRVEVDNHIKKKQQKEMFGETFPICTLMIAYNYSINKPPIIFQNASMTGASVCYVRAGALNGYRTFSMTNKRSIDGHIGQYAWCLILLNLSKFKIKKLKEEEWTSSSPHWYEDEPGEGMWGSKDNYEHWVFVLVKDNAEEVKEYIKKIQPTLSSLVEETYKKRGLVPFAPIGESNDLHPRHELRVLDEVISVINQ